MIRKKYKIHYFNEFFLMLILLNIYMKEVRLGYVRYLLYLHYIYSLYLLLPYLIISHEYIFESHSSYYWGKEESLLNDFILKQ